MILRFQADAELNQIILHAVVRRAPALDFQTAAAAGLAGLRDPEVLALAARDGRVLVTHDQTTMPRHFAAFIATATSPGVLIISQRLPIATAYLVHHGCSEVEKYHQVSAPLSRACSSPNVVAARHGNFLTTRDHQPCLQQNRLLNLF
jgi:predicted nuclease of predicted toxin-antitoxin system